MEKSVETKTSTKTKINWQLARAKTQDILPRRMTATFLDCQKTCD